MSAFLTAELWVGPCCLHATSSADPLRHGHGTGHGHGEQSPAPTAQPPPSIVPPPGGADLLGVSITSAATLQPPWGLWVRGVGAAGRAAQPPPVPSCSQGTFPGAVPNFQPPSPSICDALATGTRFGTTGSLRSLPLGSPISDRSWGFWGGQNPPGGRWQRGQQCPDGPTRLLRADAVAVQPAHRALPGAAGGGRAGGPDPARVSAPAPPQGDGDIFGDGWHVLCPPCTP